MAGLTDRTYHHGDLKVALLAAARSMVEEEGGDAFTLREAARRAGVSHGAPAHHFGDKTGLLTELAVQVMSERVEQVEAARIAAGPDPVDQLKACGMAHILFMISHPRLERLCWQDTLVHRDDPALLAVLQRMAAGLIESMSAATGKMLIPDKEANPSTLLAISVVHGFAQMVNERVILQDVPEQERQTRALAMADDMLELVGTVFGNELPKDV
ncbi:MAG: TetR/AcrR family transcriptional regulator [Halioglobus sp.]